MFYDCEGLDKSIKVLIDKDCINDTANIKLAIDSYMKKEELIKILQTTDFCAIKNFSIDCITSFVTEKNDKGKTIVTTRGFDIRID